MQDSIATPVLAISSPPPLLSSRYNDKMGRKLALHPQNLRYCHATKIKQNAVMNSAQLHYMVLFHIV